MSASAASGGGVTLSGGGTSGLHVLYTQGPFTLVGQCLVGTSGNSDIWAGTYLVSSEGHSAQGMLSSEFAGNFPDNTAPTSASYFNSASGPQLIMEPAPTDENPGVGGTVSGSTDAAFYGPDEDEGGWSAVSSDLKDGLAGESSNGANVGGPPSSDCVFEGSVIHS